MKRLVILNNRKLSLLLAVTVMIMVFCTFQPAAGAEKISLEKALQLGLNNNLELKKSGLDKEKSALDLELAERSFYPQVNLESTYTRMGEAPQISTPFYEMEYMPGDLLDGDGQAQVYLEPETIEGPKDNYKTTLSINQPLYMGGKIRLGIKQARKGKEMASVQAEQKKSEILNSIIQSYYNTLMAGERVEIEEKAVRLVEEHKEIAQVSFEVGTVLKTDVLQAEIEASRARNSLDKARNELQMAKKRFKNLLGIKREIDLTEPGITPEIKPELEHLYRIALEQRPEIKLTELDKEMVKTNIELETKSNFPRVALIGNYSWQGSELNFENGSGNLLLNASISLFDGGKSKVEEDKLERELDKVETSYSSLKDGIELDLEQSLMNLKEYKNNIELQEMNLAKARESLSIEEKRYEQGMGRSVDVIQAQTTLKQTEMAKMQAEYQYKMSLFDLLQKTGRLVDYCEEVINGEK